MAIKTAEEEAYEENFIQDIKKIGKEITVLLNNQMPLDKQFYTGVQRDYIAIIIKDKSFGFYIGVGVDGTKKIKWGISVTINNPIDHIARRYNIPVSHRDIYTKQELERAKNSILVKILNYMKSM